jgi:hypothetical protein
MAAVEMAGAHREFEGVDLVAHTHALSAAGRNPPGGLVELLPFERLAAGARREALHMPAEVAHHIRTGRPHRQRDVEGVSFHALHVHTNMV